MKKNYTKRQILEAIKHWQKKLDELQYDTSYNSFFCKSECKYPSKSINIKAPQYIREAIASSNSKFNKSICVFNPSSYLNILRLKESNCQYLDEKERQTEDISKLVDAILKYCKNNIKDWKYGIDNFDSIFDLKCYDPNAVGNVYGNILLSNFPFDVSKTSIEKHIEILARRALLLGYNYVAHDIEKTEVDDGIKHCYASVQFEATYFSSNVKVGNILYHVAPKSISRKILSKGLVPSNKNMHNFSYSSRVYMFIDRYDQIMQDYAAVSGKQSKKFVLSSQLKTHVLEFYEELQKKTSGKLFNTHEYTVFAIDTAKLDNIKLYRDNTFDIDGDFIAVYSVAPIPPNAISIVQDFIA